MNLLKLLINSCMKIRDITESFKRYKVKHKKSGKVYPVTAMHDKSAKEKARVQHGGTASRYTGTSTDDFEIVNELDNRYNQNNPLAFADKEHGLKAVLMKKDKGDVYISYQHGKETGRFSSLKALKKHQEDLINKGVDENLDYLEKSKYKNMPMQLELQRVLAQMLGIDDYYDMDVDTLEKKLKASGDDFIWNEYSKFKHNLRIQKDDKKSPTIGKFASDNRDPRKFASLEESVGQAITEAEFDRLAEKKDACYHKVKSRYKVWPSAYASGALVQCRKKGAANWGNSKKK